MEERVSEWGRASRRTEVFERSTSPIVQRGKAGRRKVRMSKSKEAAPPKTGPMNRKRKK